MEQDGVREEIRGPILLGMLRDSIQDVTVTNASECAKGTE